MKCSNFTLEQLKIKKVQIYRRVFSFQILFSEGALLIFYLILSKFVALFYIKINSTVLWKAIVTLTVVYTCNAASSKQQQQPIQGNCHLLKQFCCPDQRTNSRAAIVKPQPSSLSLLNLLLCSTYNVLIHIL